MMTRNHEHSLTGGASLVLAALFLVVFGPKSSSFVRFAEANHWTTNNIADYYNGNFWEVVQDCLAEDPVYGECPSHWYSGNKRA